MRELAARFVAGDRLVGLAIGVVVDGELVLGEGFGARHVESGGAVDTRTVFRVGSITKVFTTMTALHLAERGRLDLDAPAAELLPELDALLYPGADARRITVRDLITHTAGLPRDPDLPPLSRDKPTTRAELMQAIDGLSLVRPPGVAHEYSNLGFSLLGHVVAAASERAGVFRLDCERGRAELSLSLTSAREPMLAGASITWLDGTPTPEVQTAAIEVTPLLTAFDADEYRQLIAPNLQQSRMERLAPLVRFEFGTCRPGKPLEVTGPDAATFELTCDRGTAKLSLTLDRGTPRRIASLRVSPGNSAPACR